MKIGLISDTHGELWGATAAARRFQEEGIDLLIHAGDIGSLDVVDALSHWPAHYVRGNCDPRDWVQELFDEFEATFHGEMGSLEVEGRKIAFLHGHKALQFKELVQSGEWDAVLHGHTHDPVESFVGETLIVNPGAISRTRSPSVAILTVPALKVRHVSL